MHCQCEVDVHNSVAYFHWTHIIECYVVRYGSKNGYQKDVLKEIRLLALNMIAILGSIVNIVGGGGGYMTIQ